MIVLAKTEKVSDQLNFAVRSFEIILVYALAFYVAFTFMEDIKNFFYVSLAYISLFMFLTIFLAMISYTMYNLAKVIESFYLKFQ